MEKFLELLCLEMIVIAVAIGLLLCMAIWAIHFGSNGAVNDPSPDAERLPHDGAPSLKAWCDLEEDSVWPPEAKFDPGECSECAGDIYYCDDCKPLKWVARSKVVQAPTLTPEMISVARMPGPKHPSIWPAVESKSKAPKRKAKKWPLQCRAYMRTRPEAVRCLYGSAKRGLCVRLSEQVRAREGYKAMGHQWKVYHVLECQVRPFTRGKSRSKIRAATKRRLNSLLASQWV